MSKLATIEQIKKGTPHPNADRLDLVQVLGYQCVTQKGLYKEGDYVVYIKTDTILPELPWAEEYRKYSPKRVKAVRLRGEWSEGIILSVEDFVAAVQSKNPYIGRSELMFKPEGSDVSELLGVTKYEPPVPQDLSAKAGRLPYELPKTDEERWENMVDKLPFGERVDVTLKIDGQSATYLYKLDEDYFGVTGRSLELKPEADNNYTRHIDKYYIAESLAVYCKTNGVSLAIRGESYGQGIQNGKNNPHSQQEKGLAIFSVYLIDERRYANKGDKFYFKGVADALEIPHVPILEEDVVLTEELIQRYSTGLKRVGGKPFEGVVINHSRGSFKVINKHYDAEK